MSAARVNIDAVRAVLARTHDHDRGWARAYRDDVGALLEEVGRLTVERDALHALRQYMHRAVADDIDMSEAFALLDALSPEDVAAVMAWADAMERVPGVSGCGTGPEPDAT